MTKRYKCEECGRVIDTKKKTLFWGHFDCVKCGGRFKEANEFESLSEGDESKQDSEGEDENHLSTALISAGSVGAF